MLFSKSQNEWNLFLACNATSHVTRTPPHVLPQNLPIVWEVRGSAVPWKHTVRWDTHTHTRTHTRSVRENLD